MTLKTQKKAPLTPSHRKRTGQHHSQSKRYAKTYWPYLPVLLIVGVGMLISSSLGRLHRDVLGYATDISVSSLLSGTNQQRTANGEAILSLNSQLDQAAQAKANDMSARDYWSHNTPDGNTPWTFISAAGYTYTTAGENLAYGFTTTADTITGWMNSPEHRANILNASFKDVGFGVINIPDYQNTGPQTLVVAMYGAQQAAASTLVTTVPASTSTTGTTTPTKSIPQAPEADTPNATPADTPATSTTTGNGAAAAASAGSTTSSPEPKQTQVSRAQLLGGMTGAYVVAGVLAVIAVFFIFRHARAWHKVIVKGERFVLKHPSVDALAAAVLMLCLMLGQTTGMIR